MNSPGEQGAKDGNRQFTEETHSQYTYEKNVNFERAGKC